MSSQQQSPYLEKEAFSEGTPKASLPIDTTDGIYLDNALARKCGAQLSARYSSAKPFPHIVIDNFLPIDLAERILMNFPVAPLVHDVLYDGGTFQHRKRQIFPNDCNEFARQVFHFFNSAPILEFLEGLTGIDGLISDPHFDGGGFHEIAQGGKLGIHADFRINRKLQLHRRLNLLIYLNKDWENGFGGHLELWDKAVKNKILSIAPIFNRCVIFSTNRDSFHGHPDPLNLPDNRTRKSMALYYYTGSQNLHEETPAHGTVFFARPNDEAETKRSALVWRARSFFSFSEWLPPILYRNLRAIKAKIMTRR
jgi:hypothetical protein